MSRVLVIQAESRVMNPLLDQKMIDAELKDDREAASSEWLGQFRSSTVQFLDDEMIDASIVEGREGLPVFPMKTYTAYCDPSGGRHDAMTLAISHREQDGTCVIDRLVVVKPPFDPEAAVQHFCETIRSFDLRKVSGDRYAAEWVSSMFSKWGIRYESAGLSASQIYIESLPLFSQSRVELLDSKILITQLRMLERRPRSGGRGDLVDHPPRASDDAANAVCGALWLASRISDRAVMRPTHRPQYAIRE